MKQVKNKYFWTLFLLSTWPLTFLAFAICGYLKLSPYLFWFLACLGGIQGLLHLFLMHRWSYPDGTIKEFLFKESQ